MSGIKFQLTDISSLDVWEEFSTLSDAALALSEILLRHGEKAFADLALVEARGDTYVKAIQGDALLDLADPSRLPRRESSLSA